MKVFKLFFKLAKQSKIYIIFGIMLIVLFTYPFKVANENKDIAEFKVEEVKITIFNHDDGLASKAFTDYLGERAELVTIEENEEAVADGLFYEFTDYIITIPKGFSEKVVSGQEIPPLEKQVTKIGAVESFIDPQIATYLTSLDVIRLTLPKNPTEAEINTMLNNVKEETQVDLKTSTKADKLDSNLVVYGGKFIGYCQYVFAMVFISVFGKVLISMRNPEIVKRDWMSKMTEVNRVSQSWLASFVFAVGFWFVMEIIALIIFGPEIFTSQKGQLFTLNSFVSMLGVQTLAYCIAILSNSLGLISFFSTFVSLLLAFFSGIFAPREVVDATMQKLVMIATPIWNVFATEKILSLTQFNWENLQPIFTNFGIQLIIAMAYFAFAYIVQHYRLKNSVYLN